MKLRRWIVFGGLLACQGEPDPAETTRSGAGQGVPPNFSTEGASSGADAEGSGTSSESMDPVQEEGNRADGQSIDNGATSAEGSASHTDTPGTEEAETEGPALAVAELNDILVFTKTTGWRHDSLDAGVQALTTLGEQNGFSVRRTEESTDFNDAELAKYDVVVWLSTTEEVLDDAQQAAFERYIQGGGAWVGVHSATDTEYNWAWYGQLIGGNAWFANHPVGTPTATLRVDAASAEHSSTAHLPLEFTMQDEWYNFQANPGSDVTVLLRLDESSYDPNDGVQGAMGADHPIAWYHEYDGGRAWYTGLGHRRELYQDPRFTQHLLGGLRWAAGLTP